MIDDCVNWYTCSDRSLVITGLYFADTALYSDDYSTKARQIGNDEGESRGFQTDESEMMLAELLLGNEIEMDRDVHPELQAPGTPDEHGNRQGFTWNLKTPPIISACKTQPSPYDGQDSLIAVPGQGSGKKYNTVRGYTQTDLPPRVKGQPWTKNPKCPRSKIWIVYENGRACKYSYTSNPSVSCLWCLVQSRSDRLLWSQTRSISSATTAAPSILAAWGSSTAALLRAPEREQTRLQPYAARLRRSTTFCSKLPRRLPSSDSSHLLGRLGLPLRLPPYHRLCSATSLPTGPNMCTAQRITP